MKICIDPGHQAQPDLTPEPTAPGSSVLKARTAPGTAGLTTKTPEYAVVLQIAIKMERLLLQQGCEVVLTRRVNEINLSNVERAKIANSSGAKFCLKLHCNGVRDILKYVASWKRGAMTLIPAPAEPTISIYKPSLVAANILHKVLLGATKFPDLGIHSRKDLTGFNWSQVPVVLLELGYLTNSTEESFLIEDSFQENLAAALSKGAIEACAHL